MEKRVVRLGNRQTVQPGLTWPERAINNTMHFSRETSLRTFIYHGKWLESVTIKVLPRFVDSAERSKKIKFTDNMIMKIKFKS